MEYLGLKNKDVIKGVLKDVRKYVINYVEKYVEKYVKKYAEKCAENPCLVGSKNWLRVLPNLILCGVADWLDVGKGKVDEHQFHGDLQKRIGSFQTPRSQFLSRTWGM